MTPDGTLMVLALGLVTWICGVGGASVLLLWRRRVRALPFWLALTAAAVLAGSGFCGLGVLGMCAASSAPTSRLVLAQALLAVAMVALSLGGGALSPPHRREVVAVIVLGVLLTGLFVATILTYRAASW